MAILAGFSKRIIAFSAIVFQTYNHCTSLNHLDVLEKLDCYKIKLSQIFLEKKSFKTAREIKNEMEEGHKIKVSQKTVLT